MARIDAPLRCGMRLELQASLKAAAPIQSTNSIDPGRVSQHSGRWCRIERDPLGTS
jgi:hypothetical protein